MINSIPDNWDYKESLEMLFLFYQLSDELLSENTPDSYAVPLHNSMTLLFEMSEVYHLLKNYGMIKQYYSKYIPPIIEEFLFSTQEDYVLKRLLGERLSFIRTGFKEAKNNHSVLMRWINITTQTCSLYKYLSEYKDEIARLVKETKDKKKLLYCTSNYYTGLIFLGYSREYLYMSTKRFFSNQKICINNLGAISEFLGLFTLEKERYDFLILMDLDSIEYLDSLSDKFDLGKQINKIDIFEMEKNNDNIDDLLIEYNRLKNNSSKHSKISVVRYHDEDYDPFSAIEKFVEYVSFLQSFTKYFKHFYSSKQVYKILQIVDKEKYRAISIPRKLKKRPYIDQGIIDSRIYNIMTAKSMSFSAFSSIAFAIEMHAEAIDSRNTIEKLKTFWTALEALFLNPEVSSDRYNVINSVLPIIQKTYILKQLRAIYSQIEKAIDFRDREKLNVLNWMQFVEYYSSYNQDSVEMKKLYSLLEKNPLLRSRLYSFREQIDSGKRIYEMISRHSDIVNWQLKRIYRMRNIATHLGKTVTGIDIVVNHLHNYFDYVINYMLCKTENEDDIVSTSTIVFEAIKDNELFLETLKKNDTLSSDNFSTMLFGPDRNLIKYQFEY